MDWPARTQEIQRRFFRAPPCAYLWVDFSHENSLLSWCFTFMDLGMCHTISSTTTVVQKNGCFLVGRESWPTEDMALEAVFGGHYEHFLQEFYRDVGFTEMPETDTSGLTDQIQERLRFTEST